MNLAKMEKSFDNALKEIREVSSESVEKIANQAELATESVQTAVRNANKSVQRNPWYFIGGAAMAAALVGFLAGRKSKF
ncbi:MAG: hypothetical protein ACXWQO_05045 [Bdellovibrionota bacterium]